MSDILRAKEAEDVLSSIRRLVSAEPRQVLHKQASQTGLSGQTGQGAEKPLVLGRPQPVQSAPLQIKQPEEGKLVLGPALRVSEDSPLNPLLLGRKPGQDVAPDPQPNPQPDPQPAPRPEATEALGSNVTAFPKPAEATIAATPSAMQDVVKVAAEEVAEEEVEDAPFIEILDDVPQSAEVKPFPLAAASLPPQPVGAPAPQEAAAQEDMSDDLAAEAFAAEDDFENEAEAEDPRGHWSAQHLPEVAWIAEAGSEWDDEESRAFEALRRQSAPAEADDLPPEWADQAEAEVRAQLQEPQMETGELVGPADALNMFHAPSLDEAALRDIVRQMIREELSGSLGERITRNVRKLVRIEVNRALTHSTLE